MALILRGLALVVFALSLAGCGVQSIPQSQNDVEAALAEVTNQYKRRADLIPNLVNTVKGYAAHESETLEAVIAARAKATSMTIDPSNLDAQQIQQFQAAQGGLSQALGRLMVVAERYPDLKADRNFRELQAQLEGTENRINVARTRFNDASRTYNTKIRTFPANLFANTFGFTAKPYFEAEAGSEAAPKVKF